MNLSEQERQNLFDLAPKSCRDGTNWFSLCPLCGEPEWQSGDTAEPKNVLAEVGDRICRHCEEVACRAPEIFNWVVNVIKFKARLDLERTMTAPQPAQSGGLS